MPKLPRSVKDSRARSRAATDGESKPKGNGKRNGKTAKQDGAKGSVALDAPNFEHRPIDQADANGGPVPAAIELNDFERGLLSDLFAVIEEHAGDTVSRIDRGKIESAFVFACERHADQRRQSGEDFIIHPVGVAKICAGMRL